MEKAKWYANVFVTIGECMVACERAPCAPECAGNGETICHVKTCARFSKLRVAITHRTGRFIMRKYLSYIAATYDCPVTLLWLECIGVPITADVCFTASLNGHHRILRTGHARKWPIDENASASAALIGNVVSLYWLHVMGAPMTETTMYHAVLSTRVEAVCFLLALTPPCPFDERAIGAAQSSHVPEMWRVFLPFSASK